MESTLAELQAKRRGEEVPVSVPQGASLSTPQA
jgi:hypothetical protein